jgi:hypothetical protein
MLDAPPISSSLPWSCYLYMVKSISYEALHYAVFSNLLPLHPSSVHIFSLATLFSNTFSLCSSLNVRHQVSDPHKTTENIIVLYVLTASLNNLHTNLQWYRRFLSLWHHRYLLSSAFCCCEEGFLRVCFRIQTLLQERRPGLDSVVVPRIIYKCLRTLFRYIRFRVWVCGAGGKLQGCAKQWTRAHLAPRSLHVWRILSNDYFNGCRRYSLADGPRVGVVRWSNAAMCS